MQLLRCPGQRWGVCRSKGPTMPQTVVRHWTMNGKWKFGNQSRNAELKEIHKAQHAGLEREYMQGQRWERMREQERARKQERRQRKAI